MTNTLVADGYAAFREEIFDITVTEVEAVIEPYSVLNDGWREAVAFADIQELITQKSQFI